MNIFHIHCYCCIIDAYRKCIISRWIETMMVQCTCFIYPYVYHKPCGFISRDLVSFSPDLWYHSLHIWPIYHFCSIPYCHEDVMKWKHFPRYWPYVKGIQQWPMNSPHRGQWRGALMFSLICHWTNDWTSHRDAGDLRHHPAHYDVIVIEDATYSELSVQIMACRRFFAEPLTEAMLNYCQVFP